MGKKRERGREVGEEGWLEREGKSEGERMRRERGKSEERGGESEEREGEE